MPADTKVTPINKNKAAEAEPEVAEDELPERPAFVSRPHLAIAVAGLVVLMWFVYRYIGTLQVMGTGVIGGMISATLLAIVFVPVFYVVVRRVFKGKIFHVPGAPMMAGGESNQTDKPQNHE